MKKTYIAVISIALGKSTITPPNPLPNDVKPELLKQLLNNGSIEEVQPTAADLKANTETQPVKEVSELSVADLKVKAGELGIKGFANMSKASLIKAITDVSPDA